MKLLVWLRRVGVLAAGMIAAGGLLGVGGATASTVSTASTAAERAAGGTAPACIARVVDNQADAQYVWVRNECGKTMRIKIIVKGGRDTGCNTLRSGQSREWKLTWGTYDRTVVC
ncbi:hypothetical protein [Goodfellowiella coeruleoviolacea]|uniref:Uncharacterized protein n=1 Tax=Goodfellowiella coeruleoviolacea TaxID=334858 RepID=A0AAE3KG81_9PSEU|nr:hypothetical protein [Goodfellowiella coeruleoviolacea]MCP2165800.1 hypothetical protein [Goodfellowiella coeruleoviolacea]